jgi:hypothetical protein
MSDSTTSAYRIQHLLSKDNYCTWSVKLMDILMDQGLIDHANSDIPCPQHTINAAGTIVDPNGTQATAISE